MRCFSEDLPHIKNVLQHPSVYPHTINDSLPKVPPESFGEIFINDAIYVLAPNKWSVFIFIPFSVYLYHAHIAVLPEGRGRAGIRAGKAATSWMFQNTPCLKIMGFTSVKNKPALSFSRCCGYNEEGVLTKSILKDGELHDQIIFGITKEEVSKWEQREQ